MLFYEVFVGFLFLCVVGAFVFLLDSSLGGLDFSTKSAVMAQVNEIILRKRPSCGVFYDLGSARGKLASKIAKANPELIVHGIDDNWFRTVMARARGLFLKNISFAKQDIFSANISQADIIYIYLPQELMTDLETKLQKELKNNALVITNNVSFPNWKAREKIGKLFLYAKE